MFVCADPINRPTPCCMLACCRAPTRAEALRGLSTALKEYQIGGLPNNLEFLQRCVDHPAFQVGPPVCSSSRSRTEGGAGKQQLIDD